MSTLAGTGALVRLALRRDRIRLPAWVVGITLLVVSTAASFQELFRSAQERAEFAASFASNTGLRALYGPLFDTSVGGLTAWRIGSSAALVAGVMSLLLIVRHTRAEEEAGRSELLGATVVGRHAGLAAALIVVGIANASVGALVAVGLIGTGLPAGGSVAFGLTLAGAGCLFGGVAAVAAQLGTTARAASGGAGALLGFAYMLRVVGDVGDGTLSWLSPIGWAVNVRPFAGERWWVLLLYVALTAAMVPAAFALVSRRDHGGGLLAARLGPETASTRLRSPLGLAWRLQRGVLAGWGMGFIGVGVAIGAVAKDVGDLSGELSELIRRLGDSGDLVDAFLAGEMGFLALAAAGYVIEAVTRIRTEETELRAEPVLATSVGRWSWAGSHLVWAAAGTVVIMALAGAATGLAYGLRIGDVNGQVPRLLGAALAQVPAAWVMGGVACAFTGLAPRFVALAWGVFSACFGLGFVGELLELPQWALDISPFQHVPQAPVVDVTPEPLLVLGLVALGLTAIGLIGLRNRDIL